MTSILPETNLDQQLIFWRRDFHQYAESGFLEMRTASIVAEYLSKLGYHLKVGSEVMVAEARMGVPPIEILNNHYKWAEKNGANLQWLPKFAGGMTGIVATLTTGKVGPTTASRVDMDALDIQEDLSQEHVPFKDGYASINANMMHACAHDGHTAIGLGLATLLMENKNSLTGTIKLIFQPAEEGTRGAKSMVEAGVVEDVDYFIATHLGTGIPTGEFVAGNSGYLATTKMDVTFKGIASHAGGKPEEGRNALTAAASAVLGLYGIPRHSAGASRVNVGVMNAGSGRNVIASNAFLKIETRGESSEINEYIRDQALSVLEGAAKMYQVDVNVDVVGEALSSIPSKELVNRITACAESDPAFSTITAWSTGPSGSEDATYFMNRVIELGGQATYCVVGSDLAAGHHNERFDIDEKSLRIGVNVLYRIALELNK
ncbi:amidohydrolase [Paenisporosarcina sp. TG20]|uniref:amidohydrolase n=1 Tax=Paenisporosarcina sp. TG20 TaxID=1211706 RepID=UPI0002FB89E4|nr:amidohydrolase [Paenisporosarcina sp. TG20]